MSNTGAMRAMPEIMSLAVIRDAHVICCCEPGSVACTYGACRQIDAADFGSAVRRQAAAAALVWNHDRARKIVIDWLYQDVEQRVSASRSVTLDERSS